MKTDYSTRLTNKGSNADLYFRQLSLFFVTGGKIDEIDKEEGFMTAVTPQNKAVVLPTNVPKSFMTVASMMNTLSEMGVPVEKVEPAEMLGENKTQLREMLSGSLSWAENCARTDISKEDFAGAMEYLTTIKDSNKGEIADLFDNVTSGVSGLYFDLDSNTLETDIEIEKIGMDSSMMIRE